MEDPTKYISNELRSCRARCRMTQKDVAKAIGVSEATVYNYEAGVTSPTVKNLWDMADLYGVSLDEITGRDRYKAKQAS